MGAIGVAWDLLPVLVFAVSFVLEPRKLRTGVYLLLAIGWVALLGFGRLLVAGTRLLPDAAGADLVLGTAAVIALTLAGLCLFLIHTGIVLVGKEGASLAHLLSLLLGGLLLGYLVAVVTAVLRSDTASFGWLFLIGLPVGYLGFGFAAFVVYGLFYPAWMGRFGPPPAVVIVLGSGLIDGEVPPLLAARLGKARAVFERGAAAGRPVRMVTSGGKGEDEPVAEAVAMRDFLVAGGFAAPVLVEDRSVNTEQNLAYSAELLRAESVSGPVTVVTSDFHALRAALLMRKAGLPGYAVGARTPRYFWPAAVIREYAAVLRDHFWLNAALVALLCVPLGLAIARTVLGWPA